MLPDDVQDVLNRMSLDDRLILIGFINDRLSVIFGIPRPVNFIVGLADLLSMRPVPPNVSGKEAEYAGGIAEGARQILASCQELATDLSEFHPHYARKT
jgi:hypothetical protein